MEPTQPKTIPDDRRIKLLNFLLQKHKIPEFEEFNLDDLLKNISADDLKKIYTQNPEFEKLWQHVNMSASLSDFLLENGLAKQSGDNLQLTHERGRDLKKQGSYSRLLADERHIADEARRVNELEKEADRTAHRQYKINVLIALGTCIAALYYVLEILDGFFGFYTFHHH